MSRQDKESATTYFFSFLGDTQMLLPILRGVKGSAKLDQNALTH
jgi:hypothetical protein